MSIRLLTDSDFMPTGIGIFFPEEATSLCSREFSPPVYKTPPLRRPLGMSIHHNHLGEVVTRVGPRLKKIANNSSTDGPELVCIPRVGDKILRVGAEGMQSFPVSRDMSTSDVMSNLPQELSIQLTIKAKKVHRNPLPASRDLLLCNSSPSSRPFEVRIPLFVSLVHLICPFRSAPLLSSFWVLFFVIFFFLDSAAGPN